MIARVFAAISVLSAFAGAADKKPVVCSGANSNIGIEGIAVLEKDAIKQIFGSDLGGSIAVVEVRLSPKGDKPMKVFLDDFLLRSYKDGQKSQPFSPSQIAGKGALVVSTTGNGGAFMGNQNGPIWGGIGGGRPQRMGGDGGQLGNSDSVGSAEATITDGAKEKEDPLLAVLKSKVLPEKETAEPLNGYLYFPLDGKHKAKDLTLVYQGAGGRLTLEFKELDPKKSK